MVADVINGRICRVESLRSEKDISTLFLLSTMGQSSARPRWRCESASLVYSGEGYSYSKRPGEKGWGVPSIVRGLGPGGGGELWTMEW